MYPCDVALIQSNCHVVRRLDERDEMIKKNLKRINELVGFANNRVGEIKLAVTGEYSLYGQFRPRSLDEWLEMALPIPNFATDILAETCVKMKLDQLAAKDPKAKAAKPQDFIDARFVEEFDTSGYIDSLYGWKK